MAARAVGSYMPRLTRKAFEKYGFSAATLFTDWATIAGAELARLCAPERLKWPRHVEPYGEVGAGSEGRPGATLVLRADPAFALEVEYRAAQLIDRINGYFGYRAVADVRIVQAPVMAYATPQDAVPATSGRVAPGSQRLAAVQDEALRAALARLEAGVLSRAKAAE